MIRLTRPSIHEEEIGGLADVQRLASFASVPAAAETGERRLLGTEEVVDLGFALPLCPTLSADDPDRVGSPIQQGLQRGGS